MRKDFTINHMNELIDHVEAVLSPIDEIGNILIDIVDFLVPWWEREAQVLAKSRNEVIAIFEEVSSLDTSYAGYVQDHDRDIRMPVERYIAELANIVRPGTTGFSYGPNQIDSMIDSLPHSALPYRGGDNASDNGTYGGNQNTFDPDVMTEEEFNRCVDIIKKHKGYEHYTPEMARDLLKRCEENGCGYIAIGDTLLADYEEHEDDFLNVFGYPLYKDKNKRELNSRLIALDIICTTLEPNDPITTSNEDRTIAIKSFLDSKRNAYSGKGFYIPEPYVDNYIDVNPGNFAQLQADGAIIMHAQTCATLTVDNGESCTNAQGEHAMVVTASTEDNELVISTWGGKAYFDLEDCLVKVSNHSWLYHSGEGQNYSVEMLDQNADDLRYSVFHLSEDGTHRDFLYEVKSHNNGLIGNLTGNACTNTYLDEQGNTFEPSSIPFSWEDEHKNAVAFQQISYQEAYS